MDATLQLHNASNLQCYKSLNLLYDKNEGAEMLITTPSDASLQLYSTLGSYRCLNKKATLFASFYLYTSCSI